MTEGGPQRLTGGQPAPGWWQASDGLWYPPAPPPRTPVVVTRGGSNGFGVAALVLGIVGAVFAFTFPYMALGFLCGLLAVIFGAIGLQRGRRWAVPVGPAIAGLVLGISAMVVAGYYLWVINRLFETVSSSIERSAAATDADPTTNRLTLDRCGSDRSRPAAEGTLVNTGSTRMTFRVHVRFTSTAGSIDQPALTSPIEPGATGRWTASGVADAAALTSCALVQSPPAFGAPTPPASEVPAAPAR